MKILITGSAKRIGAAIARYFAEKGHAVVVHCNTSIKEAEELVASFPNPSLHKVIQMDLTLPDAPSKLFKKLQKNPPDVLVNNASVYSRIPLEDATPAVMKDAFAINFMIPFELMRCFHNWCKKGNIINILDHRVNHPDPTSGPYAFAKKSPRLPCQRRRSRLRPPPRWRPPRKDGPSSPGLPIQSPPDAARHRPRHRLHLVHPLSQRPDHPSLLRSPSGSLAREGKAKSLKLKA